MERHGQNDNKMGEDFKFGFIGLLGFLCKGGLGAKPPASNTGAGSPEGGLERLGAHRKVQENLRVVMELVIFCNSFSIGNRLALPRASGRSRPPPTPPADRFGAGAPPLHPVKSGNPTDR